jgi:EpsI family protein
VLNPLKSSVALAALMLAATGVITALAGRNSASLAHSLDSLPLEINGWKSALAGTDALAPDALAVLKPTAYLSRDYEKQGERLGLFIAYYAAQRAGETMHSPRHCLPGNGWDISRQQLLSFNLGGQRIVINDDLIRKVDQQEIMLYWYQSRRRIFANEFKGKFLLLRDAILDGDTEGSLVRIILPDIPGMKPEGVAFAKALIPGMQWCLGVK